MALSPNDLNEWKKLNLPEKKHPFALLFRLGLHAFHYDWVNNFLLLTFNSFQPKLVER